MEKERKWSGLILIAVIVIVAGTLLVMNTLATSQPDVQPPTQSTAPLAADSAQNNPMSQTGGAADSQTANASVIGYGGPVLVRLTLNAQGEIEALDIGGARFAETEGVGSKVRDSSFAESFMDKTPPLTLGEEVDGISGATFSSQAVVDAVNEAAAFLMENQAANDKS